MSGIETVEFLKSKIGDFGGPDAYNHYAVGWGARDGHALPMDQASRIPLGWYAQRHDRALAEWHQSQGRDPFAVLSCYRCRPDDPGSGGSAAPDGSSTACSRPHGGLQHGLCVRRRQGGRSTRSPIFRDVSATVEIYHKGGPPSPGTARLGHVEAAPAFDDDVWELYDTNKDWTQSRTLRKTIRRSSMSCRGSG